MRVNKNKNQLLMLSLAVGFFIGILYENMVSKTGVDSMDLFRKSYLDEYLQMKVIAKEYLWYVVKARLIILAFFCILGCVKWKKVFAIFSVGIIGICFGMLASSAVLQIGVKGIFLCFAGLFPQGIFYGLVYGMLFAYWYGYPQRSWNHTKTVFVVFMFLVGILMETYVNPIIVKGIIRMI